MSGDRLAQIEAAVEITLRRARDSAGSQPEFVVAPNSVSCADVLALVEIAEAARRVVANQIFIRYDNEADPMWDLKDALAKLDRPSSDRRADSGAAE